MEELKYLETTEDIEELAYLICDLLDLNKSYNRFGIDDLIMTYIGTLEDLVMKLENKEIREKAIEYINETSYSIITKNLRKILLRK